MLGTEAKVKYLVEALRIYSPTGQEAALARYLVSLIKSHGAEAWIDEVGNVVSIKGSGSPVIWLHAHMDTVPGYIEVRQVGNRIVGRGASDDKGPLMAMTMAFLEHEPARGTVALAAVVDEEGGSRGTKFLMNGSRVPRPDAIIVGEPTGIDKVVTKYRGGAKVRVEVATRGGHASSPTTGTNAILVALGIYEELKGKLGAGPSYEDFTVTPTVIRGGEVENAIPSSCALTLDVRIPPGKSCSDLMRSIGNLGPWADSVVRVTVDSCTEPVEVSINNPAARSVVRAIIKVLGTRPVPARKWGTSDMNELASLTKNIVAYGPGDGQLSHSMEESIDINEYLRAIDVYRVALEELEKLL